MGGEISTGLYGNQIKIPAQEPGEFSIPKKYEPSERRSSSNSANVGNIDATAYSPCADLEDLGLDQDPNPPPLGTLSFEARYQSYEEQLTIRLIGAKRLPVRHHVTNVGESCNNDVIPCDPKVFVCLLPEEKPILESYTQEGTQDPDFDETFMFKLGKQELKEKTVRFTVFDTKRLHKLSPIGHTLYSLKGQDLDGTIVVEREIKPHCQPYGHSRGHIYISLKYMPSSSHLAIGIANARNIIHLDSHTNKEYYVKVSHIHMNRKVKTKRTTCSEGERNPVFNHTMSFNIPVNQLSDSSLVVTLMNHGMVRGSTTIGRVVLGPYVLKSGNERSHWGRMIRSAVKSVDQWHGLYI